MNDKSDVSPEQRACLVCGRPYDTGSILLDRKLLASMERHRVIGWGLCTEHLVLHEEGYVALVECDPKKSGNPREGDKILPKNVHRTGLVALLRRELFVIIFKMPASSNEPCNYVEPGIIQKLQDFMQHPE